jgi:hypothetical protein
MFQRADTLVQRSKRRLDLLQSQRQVDIRWYTGSEAPHEAIQGRPSQPIGSSHMMVVIWRMVEVGHRTEAVPIVEVRRAERGVKR